MQAIVRQYAVDKLIDPLILDPGPTVTGIHLVSYSTPDIGTDRSFVGTLTPPDHDQFDDICQRIRSSGLDLIPGFRMGFGDSLTSQYWQSAEAMLREISGHRTGKFIALDVEGYGAKVLTEEYVESTLENDEPLQNKLVEVKQLAESFCIAAHQLGVTVCIYPCSPAYLIIRLLREKHVPVEGWSESTFDQHTNYYWSTRRYLENLRQIDQERRALAVMGCDWRPGYYDDYLRDWSSQYRDKYSKESCWIFDFRRSDLESWGLEDWLSGKTLSTLNDVTHCWSCLPQVALEGQRAKIAKPWAPPAIKGDVSLAVTWGEQRQAPGYSTDNWYSDLFHDDIFRNIGGWSPRSEWLAQNFVQRSIEETWAFSIDVLDTEGVHGLIGQWYTHSTSQEWAVYIINGKLTAVVGSNNSTVVEQELTSEIVESSNTRVDVVIRFDSQKVIFDVRTQQFQYTNDKWAFVPISRDTHEMTIEPLMNSKLLFVGVLIRNMGLDSSYHWMGKNRLNGQIKHWERQITNDEVELVMENSFPFGT